MSRPQACKRHHQRQCPTSGSRSRRSASPETRIRSGGLRCGAPRSVLRMIRNGAANISNGTAAKAAGARPGAEQAEARQPAGGELIAGAAQPGDGKAERKRRATFARIAGDITGLNAIPAPCFCRARRAARQPILNERLTAPGRVRAAAAAAVAYSPAIRIRERGMSHTSPHPPATRSRGRSAPAARPQPARRAFAAVRRRHRCWPPATSPTCCGRAGRTRRSRSTRRRCRS